MADTPSRAGIAGSYVTTVSYGSPLFAQSQGSGSGWFGPSVPMAPTAPPEVAGREWDYPAGYNLNTRPRAYEPITFGTLRALADGYDLLRTVIETRKDQLARMSWSIKSRDAEASDDNDPRVKAVTKFFQRPDGVHGWADWLRPILEDLFVIDAPTLYVQRYRGGRLLHLLQLDGATIKPVIDNWGRTPQPYSDGSAMVYPVAYQQALKGFPAVDYSTRDLLYRPRNRRVHTPFGFSPVEQIITTVNIALRRQLSTLNYYTEGNIPDMIVQVPKEWSPDQIVTYQRHWDAYFTGDQGAKRRAKFVPGGMGAGGIHETRQADLKGDFDVWLAQIICFAFSISSQALTKPMNRASAETNKEVAEEEGLQPIMLWLKAFIDDIIHAEFGVDDLEFAWATDEEVDRVAQQTILTGYVSTGIMKINEARQELGYDPLPDPEASQGMIITATGLVPLGSFAQTQQQQADQMQVNAEAKARIEAAPPPAANGNGGNSKPPPPAAAESDAAPAKKSAFNKRRSVHVRRPSPIPFDRPATRRAQKSIGLNVHGALVALAKQVSAVLRARVDKLAKADPIDPEGENPEDRARREADDIIDAFDLTELQDLAASIGDDLADVVTDTVERAMAQIGPSVASDLVDQVNQRAVQIARDRAAELVGMKYDAEGNLVPSDNPDMAITDTTREMLRQTIADGLADNDGLDEIAKTIAESYGFSAERADMIAETEVSRANSMAAVESYRSARDSAGVSVMKEWSAEADACDICSENEDAGPIDLDEEFPSGDDAPPGHCSCRCGVSPVVIEDEQQDQSDEEE